MDSSGNIYVSEYASGIAVFNSTANGIVAPTHYIPIGGLTMLTYPGPVAVDSTGNLYVVNVDAAGVTTVVVFGPGANGNVAPIRVLNQKAQSIAVDASNNLYVLSSNSTAASNVLVFSPGASGSAAPTRTISLGNDALTGITVDSAGNTYVGTDGSLLNNARSGTPTILEYSPTNSNGAAPDVTFLPSGWTPGSYPASMATH